MTDSRLQRVRSVLAASGLDAFLVGSGDAHQSEYVSECQMRRAYVSGFTGSAGTALILKDKALLWTDGRYFLQASTELSEDWTLMKSGEPGVLEINDWIAANMSSGQIFGVDAFLISASQAKAMEKVLSAKNIKLMPTEGNPIDEVWIKEGTKPASPRGMLRIHDIGLSGKSHVTKIADLQSKLATLKVNAIVVSMLDEIMWLFNIRGSDVSYNPVAICYAVVTADKAHLFIDKEKVASEVIDHLGETVAIHPYESIEEFIKTLKENDGRIACDPMQLNWRLYRAIASDSTNTGSSASSSPSIHEMVSPLTLAKSIKNESELQGIREAHIRDGVALTAFLCWLENHVRNNTDAVPFTEYDVAVKIEEFRSKMQHHVGPSFTTIAGYGTNGAIIHYKPEKETAAPLGKDSLFLLDSGAQYLDGTTDVTRTLHFGTPTQRMIDCFTMVLKGHITLARVVFPEATTGSSIDCLARVPLWSSGLDFNHGTGHGVGAFLNVHEGPQGISFRKRENEVGFYAGMTTSNEPGYYEEGAFGIRIENVCITVEANTPNHFRGKKFCCFETVTLCPIKSTLINKSLLDPADIQWFNDYHKRVRDTLLPHMTTHFPEAVDYLLKETEPI